VLLDSKILDGKKSGSEIRDTVDILDHISESVVTFGLKLLLKKIQIFADPKLGSGVWILDPG
jgi:hypothetical protein